MSLEKDPAWLLEIYGICFLSAAVVTLAAFGLTVFLFFRLELWEILRRRARFRRRASRKLRRQGFEKGRTAAKVLSDPEKAGRAEKARRGGTDGQRGCTEALERDGRKGRAGESEGSGQETDRRRTAAAESLPRRREGERNETMD